MAEKFFEEYFAVSETFGYLNFLCIRKGYLIFLSIFLSHTAAKLRKVTLLCSGKILVCEKDKGWRERSNTIFLRIFFNSLCRQNSLRITSVFRKSRISKKIMHRKGLPVPIDEVFLSHIAEKNSLENTSVLQKPSGTETFYA